MSRIFALIPAAGLSTRMGVPKLILPVPGGTVIERLVRTLRPRVDEIVVLVRKSERRLSRTLQPYSWVTVMETEHQPPDMRATVSLMLSAVEAFRRPGPRDGWMLTPGDSPFVRPGVVNMLTNAFRQNPSAIHIPTFEGQGGHPTIFPWKLAARVSQLPSDQGINAVRRLPNVETLCHPTDDPSILWDLDTPEDYQRLLGAFGTPDRD